MHTHPIQNHSWNMSQCEDNNPRECDGPFVSHCIHDEAAGLPEIHTVTNEWASLFPVLH